jgi:hypothetical protein
MGDFVQNKIMNLSAGNWGALTVLKEIVSWPSSDSVIDALYEQNIKGSKIWLLYKDVCKNVIDDFVTAVLDGSALSKIKQRESLEDEIMKKLGVKK